MIAMGVLQCDICGGKLVGRPGRIFECEYCGVEYSTDWAKAKVQEIKGTVSIEGTVQVTGAVRVEGSTNKESLLKRGQMELEAGNPGIARKCFDKVLDMDPECAEAYLAMLLIEYRVSSPEKLGDLDVDFTTSTNYRRFTEFGGTQAVRALDEYIQQMRQNIQKKKEEAEREEAEKVRRIQMEMERDPLEAEYQDKSCPACGQVLSFPRWLVEIERSQVCPVCGERIWF